MPNVRAWRQGKLTSVEESTVRGTNGGPFLSYDMALTSQRGPALGEAPCREPFGTRWAQARHDSF
jgi:hypothetical protein